MNNNTGKKGLQNVFENVNSLPFKYKDNEFKNMFDLSILENYSKKIHNICNHINNSIDSVSLIYSERIWSGVVPMAIALEEMGYSRPNKKHNLLKNKKVEGLNYIMITGNKLFSKNNKEEIKHAVQEENKNGSKIKVIIISLAGAEGIDFKFIRNAFIMDPWYNMNRLEQVIGRCIREGSHLSLPPQQRNCCIYLYAVTNGIENETIDMKVYRMAESKEIQISNVSRVIKENAIDCILSNKEKSTNNKIITNVSPDDIYPNKEKYDIGELVESYYNNGDELFKCKITKIHSNGLYNLEFVNDIIVVMLPNGRQMQVDVNNQSFTFTR